MPHAHPIPILRMPLDSFTSALSRLDPASRALLDLSLRRGMRPEEIGDLLGTDPESVIVAREGALEQLADELGMDDVSELDDVRARLAELPAEAWTGPRPGAATNGKPPPIKREPVVEEPRRRRSRLPLLLAALALAVVILVIALAAGGDDDGSTNQAPPPSPAGKPTGSKKPAPGPTSPRVRLTHLGGQGSGTARLGDGGKRLLIDADGLRNATYQVWLYDSLLDAKSLGAATGTTLQLDLKLPQDATHYKYVDVSLEPKDGNPNHSGRSVLRVPVAKLSR